MWRALQRPGEEGKETQSKWEEAFRKYNQQLSTLLGRLDEGAFAFFDIIGSFFA